MTAHLKATGLVSLLILSLVGVGCMKNSSNPTNSVPAPTPAPTNTVLMAGLAFSPVTITVAVGTTVTWKNNDGIAHTSTSDTGVWDTGNLPAGSSTSTKFSTAGTFPFHCTYHGAMGMRGTVVVQ